MSQSVQLSPSEVFSSKMQEIMKFCVEDSEIKIHNFFILNSIPNLPKNLRQSFDLLNSTCEVTVGITCSSFDDLPEVKDFFLSLLSDMTSKKRLLGLSKKPKCIGEYSSEDRVRYFFKTEFIVLQLYVATDDKVIAKIRKKL